MTVPAVSIVLPTFDRLPLLREAVASVLAQSRGDWELIIVDDGSRDGTAGYVDSLHDSRIHLVSVAHDGNPARLRNLGIARARAPWVAFLDSDDLWSPEKLASQLGAVGERPECGWTYTAYALIDDEGRELPPEQYPPFQARSGNIVCELLTHDARVACPTALVRRSVLTSVGGFDESLAFSEDFDLWLRLAAVSPALALAQRLSSVRLHAGNNTRQRPEVNLAFIAVYGKFRRHGARQPIERRLCDEQRAVYWVQYGRQMWGRGERVRGVLAFAHAFRYRPTDRELWSVVSSRLLGRRAPASARTRPTSSDSERRDAR